MGQAEKKLQQFQVDNKVYSTADQMKGLTDKITLIDREKAQNQLDLETAQAALGSINEQLGSAGTVSYTHLDVYKRQDKYGKEPDQFAAQAYDAVYLYEAALKKAGSTTDREKFRDALKNIADFVGVTGQFKFNEKRDPSMEVQVLQIKNGQFDALKK